MSGFLDGFAVGLFVTFLALIGLLSGYNPPIMPEDEVFFKGLAGLLVALAVTILATLSAVVWYDMRATRRRQSTTPTRIERDPLL